MHLRAPILAHLLSCFICASLKPEKGQCLSQTGARLMPPSLPKKAELVCDRFRECPELLGRPQDSLDSPRLLGPVAGLAFLEPELGLGNQRA